MAEKNVKKGRVKKNGDFRFHLASELCTLLPIKEGPWNAIGSFSSSIENMYGTRMVCSLKYKITTKIGA